jgi:hypothetical protein
LCETSLYLSIHPVHRIMYLAQKNHMKAIFTAALLCCFCILCSAQNLVLNPSLENYITCPGFGQFSNSYINDWDKPSYGSTDYYHDSCAGIIPSQQIPRSGNAYAGIIGYNYGAEYREYMTGTLSSPLIPGAAYYCEFYVSLNDGYIQAIRELGAYFSTAPPGPYSNALHIPLTPQVMNTVTLLDDTAAWMRVSGYFIAAGGEQYITIGNFNDDTNTTVVQVGNIGSYGSYYFVDDVWLSLSEGTGISQEQDLMPEIFPNPVGKELKMKNVKFKTGTAVKISIYNLMGEIALAVDNVGDELRSIDVSSLRPGIYFVKITSGEKIVRKKIVKE